MRSEDPVTNSGALQTHKTEGLLVAQSKWTMSRAQRTLSRLGPSVD